MLCRKLELIPVKVIFLQNFKVPPKLSDSSCIPFLYPYTVHVHFFEKLETIILQCIMFIV